MGRDRDIVRSSNKFIKKVPQSAVAPAFKLSLPFETVTTRLSHLINEDFELTSTASASSQQAWQGQIVPRRNKDRSEFTLKGWKLFAEAHDIRQGDHLSFELQGTHRLVIQNISRPGSCANLQLSTPSSSEHNLSVMNESSLGPDQLDRKLSVNPVSQPPAAVDDDLVLPDGHHTAMKRPGALEELDIEVWSGLGHTGQAAFPASTAAESQPMGMDAEQEPGVLMNMEIPSCLPPASSWPDLLGVGPDTTNSSQSRSDVLTLPSLLPTLNSASMFPPVPDWGSMTGSAHAAPDSMPTSPPGSAVRRMSLEAGRASGSHSATAKGLSGSHAVDFNVAVRSLQNDVKRFELRAERAEREEVMLRSHLTAMREDLNRALQATSNLERNMHQLTQSNPPARAESAPYVQVLKTSLWRLLSTDV